MFWERPPWVLSCATILVHASIVVHTHINHVTEITLNGTSLPNLKNLLTFMTLCQVQFYSGWVKLNLECQVVERFGTNEDANGQGNIGVGMSIANLLEDENVLNTKGFFKLKQIFIIKIMERLIVASKCTIHFGVVFLLTDFF